MSHDRRSEPPGPHPAGEGDERGAAERSRGVAADGSTGTGMLPDDADTWEEPVLSAEGDTREEPALSAEGDTLEEPVLAHADAREEPESAARAREQDERAPASTPAEAERPAPAPVDSEASKQPSAAPVSPAAGVVLREALAETELAEPVSARADAPTLESARHEPKPAALVAAGQPRPQSSVEPGVRASANGRAAAGKRATEPSPKPERASAPRRVLRALGRVAKWSAISALVLAVVGAISVVLVIRHYESGLPSVEALRSGYDPPQVTRVMARDGTLLANVFVERRTVVSFETIPGFAKQAFLAAEDASFYEHEGLDYFGMLRALLSNLRAGGTRQGGSTITQQVVKNILLEPDRTYERKIRETILARRLEQHLSKEEIFGLYLNQIYLGHGRYGIEEASRYYFGKHARELALEEAALLAGLVAAPERFSPRKNPGKALFRRGYVLRQMLQKGFITQPVYAQAKDKPLRLAPAVEAESELAPEVVELVKKQLAEVVGGTNHGGYVVTTTIDPTLQALGRRAVRENLEAYAKRQKLAPPFTMKKRRLWGAPFEGNPRRYGIYTGVVVGFDDSAGTIDVRVGNVVGRVFLAHEDRYNPKRLPPSEFVADGASLRVELLGDPKEMDTPPQLRLELGPQSALVAIDVRTREVRALVGSFEALAGGLDRATDARRQPGSAFKPFVYSYALHSRRFSPATLLELPGKASGETRTIRLREALARSDNAAAQHILEGAGPANVVQWAHAVGIASELKPTPSLALGAYEVRPLEIANAYATFASGGTYAPALVVAKIEGPGGKAVPLPPAPPKRQAMSPEVAYLTTSLLKSVIESGTGRRARGLGRPVAGKTGTTNDAKDAWFVGYSTDYVVAVWVGYDDALPLGWGESGATTALPAWVELMKGAHAKLPVTEFPRPSTIVSARIDPATGKLAYVGQEDAIAEEFLDGTLPEEVASPDAGADAAADAGVEAGVAVEDPPDASSAAPDAGAPSTVAPASLEAGAAAPPEEPPPF